MEVIVGSPAAPSKVEVGGDVLLEAAPGENPDKVRGGDGYSGGGGYGGSAKGGSDGSDGEDGTTSAGGRGSGLEIGLLGSERFSLVPGEGGMGNGANGGGGGGVIVNGKKPGDDTFKGEGFGGGAGTGNGF